MFAERISGGKDRQGWCSGPLGWALALIIPKLREAPAIQQEIISPETTRPATSPLSAGSEIAAVTKTAKQLKDERLAAQQARHLARRIEKIARDESKKRKRKKVNFSEPVQGTLGQAQPTVLETVPKIDPDVWKRIKGKKPRELGYELEQIGYVADGFNSSGERIYKGPSGDIIAIQQRTGHSAAYLKDARKVSRAVTEHGRPQAQ